MSQIEMHKTNAEISDVSGLMQRRPGVSENALEELFELLEEYAPVWYTEEHHNHAVNALLEMKYGDQSTCRETIDQRTKSEDLGLTLWCFSFPTVHSDTGSTVLIVDTGKCGSLRDSRICVLDRFTVVT